MSTPPFRSDDDKTVQVVDDRTVIGAATEKALAVTSKPKASSEALAGNVVALPAGTHLYEFEITDLIGEGGFGIVYAALDRSLERDVAIKEYMPSSLAQRIEGHTVCVRAERYEDPFQAGLKSFVNEAKLLARFDHPSLVKVFRFWEANGTAYMAMPIYKGVTLKQRLKQMSEPPSEAWLRALLTPLMDALEVIHEESCFHRDIAPDNILLIEDERPVLLDFGAARRVIGDLTQDLTVILKPGYAPVEQYAEVSAMKQGPWTDIYALAAVMYFAITGRPPVPSIGRLMDDQMKPLHELAQGRYSDTFLNAIDMALKVIPDERPQDVAAFRALLGEFHDGANAKSSSTASHQAHKLIMPADKSLAKTRRLGPRAALAAVVALAAVAGGAYFLQDMMTSANVPAETDAISSDKPVATESSKPVPVGEQTASTPTPTTVEPAPLPPEPPQVTQPVTSPSPAIVIEAPRADSPVVPSSAPPVSRRDKPLPPAAEKISAEELEHRERVRVLLEKAKESLTRNQYKLVYKYADEVLASEPENVRALQIKMRARDAERAAFESIQIE